MQKLVNLGYNRNKTMLVKIIYDPKFDANNYIRAIFDKEHLKHGRENMYENLLNSIESEKIRLCLTEVEDREQALKIIVGILTEAYKKQKINFDDRIKLLSTAWRSVGSQIEAQLEFIYKKSFPFKKIRVYLTTLSLCPYNYKEKYIYIYLKTSPKNQVRVMTHELNHFMFYYYYSDIAAKLGKEKFELLKESLTVFTNPEQEGKPKEKILRELFIKKQPTTLKQAINIGTKYLLHIK